MGVDAPHLPPAMGRGIGKEAEDLILAVRFLAHAGQTLGAGDMHCPERVAQKTGLGSPGAAIKAYNDRRGESAALNCSAEMPMRGKDNIRTAAEILVDQLRVNGVRHVFCVPGESYLAVLDAFHGSDLAVTVCRQEGGAAMMAEAVGKATGRPGVCFVTRGPGATNASPGIHIARQDSSPLVVFVGQVARDMREREAFQELDYRAVFGSMTKWATEIDDPARIPEIVSRAFSHRRQRTARTGRRQSAGGYAHRTRRRR